MCRADIKEKLELSVRQENFVKFMLVSIISTDSKQPYEGFVNWDWYLHEPNLYPTWVYTLAKESDQAFGVYHELVAD